MRLLYTYLLKTLIFLVGLLLPAAPLRAQTTLEWLHAVKTPKNTRTLALWRAGEEGFHLLRVQEYPGNASIPLWTVLTTAGDRQREAPLPGFEPVGNLLFRFGAVSDSIVLVGFEALLPDGGYGLYTHRFNLLNGAWSGPTRLVASAPEAPRPVFDRAWFRRSADGQSWCVYDLPKGSAKATADLAVFDRDFNLRWQRSLSLPPQKGAAAVRDLLCTDAGAVLLEVQIAERAVPAFAALPPLSYWPDGRPLYDPVNPWAEMPPHHNVLFLIGGATDEVAAFYPVTGGKYTPTLEMTEDARHQLYCAGFYSNLNNRQAEGYFVYTIDPSSRQARLLQQAPFPASVRKALLSERAAEDKEAVPGLTLRWMNWAADSKTWMLAERESLAPGPPGIREAVLFRLDSTFKINAVRKIDKSQYPGNRKDQLFNSVASYPAAKSGWWICRNEGNYPHNRFVLTECRAGEPKEFELGHGPALDVAFLPNTLLRQGQRWYFVGESEAGELLRIGYLKKVR